MKADVHTLQAVLTDKCQWVVPVYQRHYVWETAFNKQLPQFWSELQDKTLRSLDGTSKSFPHYFGAIIFSSQADQPFGTVPQNFLVDGQQRITTFHLALAATREVARHHGIQALINQTDDYLLNPQSAGMANPDRERYKLWPSNSDRTLYQTIIGNSLTELKNACPDCFHKTGNLNKAQSSHLLRAFWYLYKEMSTLAVTHGEEHGTAPEDVLKEIFRNFLQGFQIVVIKLGEDDDAQEIFASLNGFGEPLTPFDLVRNDVFHRAQRLGEDGQKIFDEQWKTFEEPFWHVKLKQGKLKRARADHLITHALIAEMGQSVNVGKVAAEYQHYVQERRFPAIADELNALLTHAATYRAMEEQTAPLGLTRIANVLRIWNIFVIHPLILRINALPIKDDEKEQLFRYTENWIVRREICCLTPQAYNIVVPNIIQCSKKENPVSGIFNYISSMTADVSRMPDDNEVTESFVHNKAYGNISTPRLCYILHQIERNMRDKFDEEAGSFEDLTVDHVMPQSWPENWPLPNGVNVPYRTAWEAFQHGHNLDGETRTLMDDRQKAIDTLGNLTLVTRALNSRMDNDGWEKKRTRLGDSLLALNREISNHSQWDERTIRARAEHLATIANNIWPAMPPTSN